LSGLEFLKKTKIYIKKLGWMKKISDEKIPAEEQKLKKIIFLENIVQNIENYIFSK